MAFKKIIKATSIFGSVQVFSLISSVLKSKLIAILLGPNGFGIISLLTSSVDIVRSIFGFSIETSGVKNIAIFSKNSSNELESEVSLLIKIALFSGIFGLIFYVFLAPFISLSSFGTYKQWYLVAFLSIVVLFKQLSNSYSAIFQGIEKYKTIAKISVISSFFSFILTIVFVYFLKFDGIIPSLIFSAFISYLISRHYFIKLNIKKKTISYTSVISKGKNLLLFGSLLTISGYIPLLINYSLQVYINCTAGLLQVGIYSVALMIMNGYIDMIFNAMSTEYYPRISSISEDSEELNKAVNQQIYFSMLVITPILLFFAGFSSYIIKFILNSEFLAVVPLLNWALVGMFFKAISFCMGYIILAKADKKLFSYTTIVSNILYGLLLFLGYYHKGLEGIGMAFFSYYLLHLMGIYILTKKIYAIKILKEQYTIFIITGILFIFLYGILNFSTTILIKNILLITLFLFSSVFSFLKLYKKYTIIE